MQDTPSVGSVRSEQDQGSGGISSVDTVVGTRTEGKVRSSSQDGGKVRSEQDQGSGGISSVDTVVGTRTEGKVRSSNQDGGKVRSNLIFFYVCIGMLLKNLPKCNYSNIIIGAVKFDVYSICLHISVFLLQRSIQRGQTLYSETNPERLCCKDNQHKTTFCKRYVYRSACKLNLNVLKRVLCSFESVLFFSPVLLHKFLNSRSTHYILRICKFCPDVNKESAVKK